MCVSRVSPEWLMAEEYEPKNTTPEAITTPGAT